MSWLKICVIPKLKTNKKVYVFGTNDNYKTTLNQSHTIPGFNILSTIGIKVKIVIGFPKFLLTDTLGTLKTFLCLNQFVWDLSNQFEKLCRSCKINLDIGTHISTP